MTLYDVPAIDPGYVLDVATGDVTEFTERPGPLSSPRRASSASLFVVGGSNGAHAWVMTPGHVVGNELRCVPVSTID